MQDGAAYKRRKVRTVAMAISDETCKSLTSDFASVAESLIHNKKSQIPNHSRIQSVFFFFCLYFS